MAMADNSSRIGRAPSVSSAGTASTSGAHSFVPRYTPKPEPSYISVSSAADHITHRRYNENYDLLSPTATPIHDGADFSPSALALLNSFLDSLLYNFLQKSRSTNLSKLRIAIIEVLKAKLGREALASADEELEGLVGDLDNDDGADIDDASLTDGKEHARRSSTPSIDWHLESAFKRMRLRVMVISRLGDFDDDDEEKFLNDDTPTTSAALDQSILSSPAAVYLASVLEYLAEQTLSLAGDAAYARSKSKMRRTIREDTAVNDFDDDSLVVGDIDVEKIALNPSLGRLWRTWRKNQRSITSPTSPKLGVSRRSSLASPTRSTEDMLRRQSFRRSGSNQIMQTLHSAAEEPQEEDIPDCEPSETDIAANIPLPISERDVDEIEIPGLAAVIYDENEERLEDDDDEEYELVTRPRSASFSMPGQYLLDESTANEENVTPRPVLNRKRSNSVPYAGIMPWDWLPVSVRRALAKLAEMSDVELAAITPLPEDEDEDPLESEITTSTAVAVDTTPRDASITEEVVTADADQVPMVDGVIATEHDTLTDDTDYKTSETERISKDRKELDNLPNGNVVAAAAVGAGAAGIAGAAFAKHKTQTSTTAGDGKENVDASRAGTEFVPKGILKSPKSSSQSGRATTEMTGEESISHFDNVPAQRAIEADDVAARPKPLLSVYAPMKTSADEASRKSPVRARKPSHDKTAEHSTASIANNGAAQASRSGVAFPAPLGRKVSFKDEMSGDEAVQTQPLPMDRKEALVDSKLSSPMHIANLAQPQPEHLAAQKDVVIKQSSAKIPERKESIVIPPVAKKSASGWEGTNPTEVSPVSPIEESPTFPKSPQAQAQAQPNIPPARAPTNPYAMLYDDVEPEAIGVAKTSNIPIHTPTPPPTSESRPWTPNRGARSASQTNVHVEAIPITRPESRSRAAPSPLRVSKEPETSSKAAEGYAGQSKAAAPNSEDYDLDKPIDPGRFQNWNRPKESPTIPKFYNQSVSTPTEPQRPASISQSAVEHSPKGSQASGRSSNKRASEELKEREFDALLDRKETVKYTLTPEEIRDVGPYSPKTSNERKVPAPIDTGKSSSLPAAMSPTLLRKTPPTTQPAANAQPQTQQQPQPQPQVQSQVKVQPPVQQSPAQQQRPLKISEIRKSISALSPEPIEPRKRRSGLMAREPRVLGGETKDFVDFIRSCTPTSEDQTRPAALNRWSAGPNMGPTQNGTTRSARSNMVPREPDVRTAPNGELIQFIRSGPPSAQNGGAKAVSPNTNKPLPTNPTAPVQSSGPPQVTRKTRRKRDPYAIDTDDEDEDDFTALPNTRPNGASQSENLQEFLRSTSPGPPARVNGYTNGVSSQNGGQRSISAAEHRSSQGGSTVMSGSGNAVGNSSSLRGAPDSVHKSFFSRKKYEARPAGATRSFGGHGFHYSTNDLADYLRSSGPHGAGANGNIPNGVSATAEHVRSESMNAGNSSGRLTPSGSIGMKRGDSTRRRLFGRKQMEA